MGHHSLQFAVDLVSESLEEVNAQVTYRSLGHRWDYGVGAFHFGQFYSSRATSLAEQFDAPRLHSDRAYGGFLLFQYPFDRTLRAEVLPTVMRFEQVRVVDNGSGVPAQVGEQHDAFSTPISVVRDNAWIGPYGPIHGMRTNLTYAPAWPVFEDLLEYQTWTLDSRHYLGLGRGATLAGRLLAGGSDGVDAQTFRVGGYATLRGYPDFELLGSRMAIANAELRFPFVQDLGVWGPVPLGAYHVRGAVFTDFGMVWDAEDPLRLTESRAGSRSLKDLKFGFGAGLRTSVWFVILKTDVAWTTDFDVTSPPRWHVSLGPEW
jgi:outer membrane protein assembly factor BamA